MELVRKNIHMDRIKCKAATQITVEDDRNVPDQKQDMERIVLKRGEVKVEEIRPGEAHVNVKGKLEFSVLYVTEDGTMERIDGSLPFEEQIHMEGADGSDSVEIRSELEDMSLEMINSRKLSLHALITLNLYVEELYDEEMAVELYHEEPVETKKNRLSVAEIVIQKKDILRFKEEMELPQSFPNISQIMWEDVWVSGAAFEALNGQLAVQGRLQIFLLYEGEGEQQLKCFEKEIPFQETLECQGSSELMIPDISYRISHSEIEARADFDGEERMVCLDLVLDLDVKMYEEEQLEILTDAYGVSSEVQVLRHQGNFSHVLLRTAGRMKLTEQAQLPAGLPDIEEVCHSSGSVIIDDTQLTEDGMELAGTLNVEVLYLPDTENGLAAYQVQLPFRYEMPAQDISQACRYHVSPSAEQLTVTALSGRELDLKAVLEFGLLGFSSTLEETITDISLGETDMNVIKELPSIVAYVAKEGDTIWEMGKKYYVPLEQIREMNHLSTDELKAGEKILIVR